MSTMMDWALYYRSQNLSIIPVQGKQPLIKWREYQERCASEEEIKAWWAQWPEADIGMVTGTVSNRFIVDIDGEEGRESYAKLSLPNTLKVQTKRGFQLHYNYPKRFEGRTTLAGVLPGVDTRGEGGYGKLPPSLFSDASGRYSWDGQESEIKDCPDSILKLLEESNKPRQIERESSDSWLKEKLSGLKEGNRNATFTSIAGSFRSRGYTSNDIFDLLHPHAENVKLDANELRTICDSVGQYAPKVQVTSEAESIDQFLKDEQKVEWIVPGILAKKSIAFLAGLPQTSKSWMAFDLAIEAARGGGSWLGKFPVRQTKVLLVEAERFRGETQRRFKALLKTANVSSSILGGNLVVKSGATTRLNLPQSLDAFKRLLNEKKPDLVIWDSWTTAHTSPENDRTEIQKVLEIVKSLRDEFGCTFLFINHEGKHSLQHEPGEVKQPSLSDMMGSIAIPAAAELVISVKRKDKDSCMAYIVKNTLAAAIDPFEVVVSDIDQEKTKISVRAI